MLNGKCPKAGKRAASHDRSLTAAIAGPSIPTWIYLEQPPTLYSSGMGLLPSLVRAMVFESTVRLRADTEYDRPSALSPSG
jgi:hypothetical protein